MTIKPQPPKAFHDEDGIPSTLWAGVVIIVLPFLVALSMFAGFYAMMM